MFKTLIILAVAYGLLAAVRLRQAPVFYKRRWGWGKLLLYGFASLGVLTCAGVGYLTLLILQGSSQQSFPQWPACPPATSTPLKVLEFSAVLSSVKSFPVQVNKPGTQPAYALLHPGGRNTASLPEGAKFRPTQQKKPKAGPVRNKKQMQHLSYHRLKKSLAN